MNISFCQLIMKTCSSRQTFVKSHITLFQLVGGEFDIEANFVIQDPKNVLQMLNLLQTCPETLQVSWSLPGCVCRFGVGFWG